MNQDAGLMRISNDLFVELIPTFRIDARDVHTQAMMVEILDLAR